MTDVPYSEDAEASVLSALLTSEEVQSTVIDKLDPEDFYLASHRAIYATIRTMWASGAGIDPVTVVEHLKGSGELHKAGGQDTIADILGSAYSYGGINEYVDIIRNKAVQRRIVSAAREIIQASPNTPHDMVSSLVDLAESRILAASESGRKTDPVRAGEIIMPTLEYIEERINRKGIVGVPTGIPTLDHMTSGIKSGQLWVIAARPGMGKSALRNTLAYHAALKRNTPAYIFSLEMDKEEDVERFLVMDSGIDGKKVQRGDLTPDDLATIGKSANRIHSMPIYIDDTPGVSPMEVRSKARRLTREHGRGVVYVDYLQLMSSSGNHGNREQEISHISRSLKNLARELSCPVVAMSQLNRQVDHREDKRPRMSDIRESGAVEQDSDVIIFIYRPEEYYGEYHDGEYIQGDAELIVAKQRNGPKGIIKCRFDGATMRFYEEERRATY